jgi:DNA repair exonuclease SbcCD ATPase subunit
MGMEVNSCPSCNVRMDGDPASGELGPDGHNLGKDDEEFLKKVMNWAQEKEQPVPDTEEDKKEREKALKVLSSIATIEPEGMVEEQIKQIKRTPVPRGEFEKREKQLMKLGKPFETLLERNVTNMKVLEKEIEEKQTELKLLVGKDKKEISEKRGKLERSIKILQKKKQAMISYESNILMIGGAYRNILGQHQDELVRLEADLKKRVDAFQKEVTRRKKRQSKLKNREDALDRREEELSHRFLDLKSRENEFKAKEDKLGSTWEELKKKEQELNTWEEEIANNRNSVTSEGVPLGTDSQSLKEEWLAAQKRLQADLFKMRDDVMAAEKDMQMADTLDEDILQMEEDLKDQENELEVIKNEQDRLNAIIIEKDKEIESLKEGGSGFTVDEETKAMLKILDDLLEKLPEEVVDKFAKSDDYLLYEKVLDKYKI